MNKKNNISLDDIGNKIPFSVPDNYFEQFANDFDSQISLKRVPLVRLIRPWLFMAALFAGVFFISKVAYTVYQNNKATNVENYDLYVMSQVNDAEIMDYFMSDNSKK